MFVLLSEAANELPERLAKRSLEVQGEYAPEVVDRCRVKGILLAQQKLSCSECRVDCEGPRMERSFGRFGCRKQGCERAAKGLGARDFL